MAKRKDEKARRTVKMSHIVDAGYLLGEHRIVDTIKVLQDLVEKYGPDAELEISADDCDGYVEITVYVNSVRLENDEEYAKRMKKLEANKAANEKRLQKRKEREAAKVQKIKDQEQAELIRLMRKYPEILPEDAHPSKRTHMIPPHLARAARIVKRGEDL